MKISDIETPALILEKSVFENNIAEMKKLMSKHVGALRKMDRMEKALVRLREIEEKYKDCNFTTQKHYWVWNAVTNSIIITEKAIARKESIGSHYIVK